MTITTRPAAWVRIVLAATVASAAGVGAARPEWGLAGQSATLTITVGGIRSNEGQVRVAVFDAGEQWLKQAAYAKVLDIDNRQCEWRIDGVPYGDYAIAVVHDANANGRTDRNFLGIPSEPYGFSNDARASFGPPRWEKARFAVASPAVKATVTVR